MDETDESFLMFIGQQFAIHSSKKAPVEAAVDIHSFTIVLQYLFICSEKNMSLIKTDIPDIRKIVIRRRKEVVQSSVFEFTGRARVKITDLTLTADIDAIVLTNSYRTGNCFIRQFI